MLQINLLYMQNLPMRIDLTVRTYKVICLHFDHNPLLFSLTPFKVVKMRKHLLSRLLCLNISSAYFYTAMCALA